MTKAEKELLHALKCVMEANRVNMGDGPETLYIVNFSLTEKQLSAMNEALIRSNSTDDLQAVLKMAAHKLGIQL
jgi:hypothetical protein